MSLITLVVTNNCNLHCTYCYETHNPSVMSFDTAKKIIDTELNCIDNDDHTEFDFFGGEPFLNFNLIREIFEYIKSSSKQLNKQVHCFASTNGTLIHGEIQNWLSENIADFTLGLSFDGNKNMQNINRCNSFDEIDLDFFLKNYPMQPIKMTISKETLPYLFEGVKFLHDYGFEVNCNLAYGIDWSSKDNESILEEQLYKLIDYYIKNPQIKPCLLLERSILPVAMSTDSIERSCGAGVNMRTYDIDGVCYPCQFFMPISVGVERAKPLGTIILPEKVDISLLDKKCQTCCANSICDTCYGSNYNERDNIYSRSSDMCNLNKIIIRARSYFKGKQFLNNQLTLGKDEKQALLRSIKIIQENLLY